MELAGQGLDIVSAHDLGVVACTRCTQVWPVGTPACGRCGKKIVSREVKSMQRVWALWLVGLMCYVPANVYPMLQTRTLVFTQENTIVDGAIELMHHGSFAVAFIILFASVVIPVGKFMAIAFLALSVNRASNVTKHQRQFVYEMVEYIGRWSMIDIFVVAIMSSLVQLNTIASINPGRASLFFALSVIFTMLSAQAFDSRMIWDVQAKQKAIKT
ncbi:paraquat-inducible protein A [Falsihalocynthiibacter arcticus]|uniref:Paraquat-inducible protein A n=1 Tax=Falsihalocynthiibacter arcticus TaxID=1579316 RepID=A0A126UZZ6_9RHOB|nr:paraquat-inducible protein A [Falsihalocynthiibacter arcticus]AML51019.1 paraquat-inducible protein A [Falsihalocynthiibacter arcticus]